MTRQLPDQVAQVGRVLAATAGGYLRNTVRAERLTCAVCSTPVENDYLRCYQCKTHVESGLQIADRVASIVYAMKPSASGRLDQTYTAMFGFVTLTFLLPATTTPWVILATAPALAIGAAAVFYRYVEAPAHRLAKAVGNHTKSRSALATEPSA